MPQSTDPIVRPSYSSFDWSYSIHGLRGRPRAQGIRGLAPVVAYAGSKLLVLEMQASAAGQCPQLSAEPPVGNPERISLHPERMKGPAPDGSQTV